MDKLYIPRMEGRPGLCRNCRTKSFPVRETNNFRSEETRRWISKRFLNKTEGLIFTAQEQALITHWKIKNIDRQEMSGTFRMCVWSVECGVTHLIVECKKR